MTIFNENTMKETQRATDSKSDYRIGVFIPTLWAFLKYFVVASISLFI